MHWPSSAQRPRIAEIHDNLIVRIAEAEREGWHGEAEALKISLAGARDKLAQLDRRSQPAAPINVGMPAFTSGVLHTRGQKLTPRPTRSEDHFKFRECAARPSRGVRFRF
jgi:hypothetical protein